MSKKYIEPILKKVRSDGLVISRVPKPTRDAFIKLANDEFAGDYGMVLKFLIDNFIILDFIKNLDYKLNYALELLEKEKTEVQEEKPEKEIKLLSGKKIKIKEEVKNG